MQQYVGCWTKFDAAHRLPDGHTRVRCLFLHGHRWRVDVIAGGDTTGLEDVMESMHNEHNGKNLNDLYPTLETTPEQMAVVFLERLMLRYPQIESVSVGDGHIVGIARQTKR